MKVYVAGPDVFRPDAKEYFVCIRALIEYHGMEALIPLDNEVSSGSEVDVPAEIYKANVAMIDACDVVIANIEPFRGPHMDPGTAFEIGYAVAKEKKIYAYTPYVESALADRIEGSITPSGHRDVSGMIIENFGETENLMITVPSSCIFRTLEETVKAVKTNLG